MLRILCLHGSRQTGEIFENQLGKLRGVLSGVATLDFVDAPHLLPLLQVGDAVHTRSWCCRRAAAARGGAGGAVDAAAVGVDEEQEGVNVPSAALDYSAGDAVVDAKMASQRYDVLLGFSQGSLMACRYVMRHRDCSLKGLILAGTPDPRHVFVGSALLKEYEQRRSHTEGFLGSLPSLHIVGRKDSIVKPKESEEFAAACGATAELLQHDHAHSIPMLQAITAAVLTFCRALAADPAEQELLVEARNNELDMIVSMYGEECLRNRDHPGGAYITLPLLNDVTSVDGAGGGGEDVDATRVLDHLRVQFHVPRRYPAVLPELDIVGGPRWHSVPFEQWKADVVLRTLTYMQEDVGLREAMLLPGMLFACEQASESLEALRVAVTAGVGRDAEDGDETPVPDEWATEDEVLREEYIAAAERAAVEVLKQRPPPATERKPSASGAEGDESGLDDAAVSAGAGKQQGGSWTLTIGLIGKPSAGKSTFFNAVTDPASESEAARVAAFPFTTIEPNVGTGFGPVFCPCATLSSEGNPLKAGFAQCDAAYGHVRALCTDCYRRHPIMVKDVAGLVQGAYQGKGKGNQFLNDLCDADVLVHVVDGAGATDADGSECAPGQGSTLSDIAWVRAEVHGWIYDNLRAKWPIIQRIPVKLRTMFSGYRSSPAFVDTVLQRMGIMNELALKVKVKSWGPKELHVFVALYVHMRFPMVIALNKADLPTAAPLAGQLRVRYPDEVFVPMSAKTEWDLLGLRKKGYADYLSGEDHFTITEKGASPGVSKGDAARLQGAQAFFAQLQLNAADPAGPRLLTNSKGEEVPQRLVSTGVQDVIALALARCAAVLVYPVSAFQPSIPSLRTCFSVKQGTTAEDVFWAMTYAKLLDGKFVRFEGVDAQRPHKDPLILKKTDVLPAKRLLARVLSNKRQMT